MGDSAYIVGGFACELSAVRDSGGRDVHMADHISIHGHILAQQDPNIRHTCQLVS